MSGLLDQLDSTALPDALVRAFVKWCVWEQARPALAVVLLKNDLSSIADQLNALCDWESLLAWSAETIETINRIQHRPGYLGLSAAKGATFEYQSLVKAAGQDDWDPEGAAFFSARVCGWAGWAVGDFRQPTQKIEAERLAREEQEARLRALWQQFYESS